MYVAAMAYWVLKVILTPVFMVLWRVRVEGREHVPAHGPAVLAANHQSFCDSFFLPLAVTRRKVTYLAKAEYFDSWRTAWFFRAAGQIPISRQGGSASERALLAAKEVLERGGLIGLYPEGTRTMDHYVHKGRTGMARLSRECGIPIIPVGIIGTVDVQPVNSRFMRPFKRVTVRFGEPMRMPPMEDPDDYDVGHDHTECRAFTDRVMHEIARLAERPYVDEYVPKRRPAPAADGGSPGVAPAAG